MPTEPLSVPGSVDVLTGEMFPTDGEVLLTQSPSVKALAGKLAKVMAAAHRVPKRGFNDFHKYHYALESDIVDTVRLALAENNVFIFQRVLSVEPVREVAVQGQRPKFITRIWMRFEMVDADSGEVWACKWPGDGEDAGDKAIYKAETGALKYFLLKTFLIPTGDDPEGITDEERRQGSSPQRQTRPADVAKAAAAAKATAAKPPTSAAPSKPAESSAAPPPAMPESGDRASAVFKAQEALGWDRPTLYAWIAKKFGGKKVTDLSPAECAQAIAAMQATVPADVPPPAPAPPAQRQAQQPQLAPVPRLPDVGDIPF